MATDDINKEVAKKAAKKTVKKATKKAAKKATKKTAKKATKKTTTNTSSTGPSFETETPKGPDVRVNSKSDEIFEHSIKAFDELSQAFTLAADCAVEKIDKASLKAKIETQEALKRGREDVADLAKRTRNWAKESPLASTIISAAAASAAAATVAAAARKVFKK